MNVKPIPKRLLRDRITLILPTENGFSEKTIINVRVERSESIENYSGSDIGSCTEITVWADRENTAWMEFPVGAKVLYGGSMFTITEQKVYYAGEPHHCKFKAKKTGGGTV